MISPYLTNPPKSPGQIAYEEDVALSPFYHDGLPRVSWNELSAIAKESWERNPTPRDPEFGKKKYDRREQP